MAQSALNGPMDLPADTWVLVSEINCTFAVLGGKVEILGMDGAAPADADRGIPYHYQSSDGASGEIAATDVLAMFPGAGTADRIYARSRGGPGLLFVSRAAVA